MNKKQAITILAIAAFLIAVYFYMEDQENKKKIGELEDKNFKLLYQSIKADDSITVEIKQQLSALAIKFSKTDQDIAQEIAKAMNLLQIHQKEKSIESLTKIMEHLLKKLYTNNLAWQEWMKENDKNLSKPHIHDLLDYCYNADKLLIYAEYQFYMAIKEVRNREAHDVNYTLEKNLSDAGLLAAVSGIIRIQSFVETKKVAISLLSKDANPKLAKKKEPIQDAIIRDAKLSECGKYRYALSRIWDVEKPRVLFVMINPSTANAQEDDATIRRCIAFAKSWNYGGLFVTNLFAFINKDPEALVCEEYPVGAENDKYIKKYIHKVDKVICAWGNRAVLKKLGCKKTEDELKMLNYFGDKLHYLELAVDGTPKHPGRLRKGLMPKRLEAI